MEASTSSLTDRTPTGSQTHVIKPDQVPQQDSATLRLTLRRTSADKKVTWNSGTVDNEHLGKKKSKCCCIYKKPLQFGESSSEEDDDECDNCFGHVEKKTKNKKHHDHDHDHDSQGHVCSS